MKKGNKKNNWLYVVFAVMAIILGIIAILTAETSIKPIYYATMRGGVLIFAGIMILVCVIAEKLHSKK
nr:hypothetical protein [uncultured Butyrivibrio sp.]